MWLLFCYCRDTMAGFKEATANAEARRERELLLHADDLSVDYTTEGPRILRIYRLVKCFMYDKAQIFPPFFVSFFLFLAVFHSSYTVDDGIRLMPTQTIWGQQSKRLAAMFCQHAIKQSDLCD